MRKLHVYVLIIGVLFALIGACVPAHASTTTRIPEVSDETQPEQSTILLLLLLLD